MQESSGQHLEYQHCGGCIAAAEGDHQQGAFLKIKHEEADLVGDESPVDFNRAVLALYNAFLFW